MFRHTGFPNDRAHVHCRPMPPGAIPPPTLFTAQDVSVRLPSRTLLESLSFNLPTGALIGILGPNGSGKTTLLRCMAGTQPYEGRLLLAGKDVRAWVPRDLARQLAFVRQMPTFSFEFSVAELVLLGRAPHKRWLDTYTRADHDRVAAVLADVGLHGFENRSVMTLSGGELQRALLAQALTQEARLLLLDEPTAHLDIHYQFDLMERLRALIYRGYSAIVVFHDLELAGRYADHLLVLRNGMLVADGSPAQVLTPDLIASIFHMEASVHTTADGWTSITYHRPLPPGNLPASLDHRTMAESVS